MDSRHQHVIVMVSIVLGSLACTSAPPAVDDEGREVQVVEAQIDDRENLEEAFDLFLLSTEIAPDIYRQGSEALTAAVEEKAQMQEGLVSRLRSYREMSAIESEDHDWASLRLAQTYLNMGCELYRIDAPEELTEEQKEAFRQTLFELVDPLLETADEFVAHLSRSPNAGASVWRQQGRALSAALQGEEREQVCLETRDLWMSQGS